MVAVDRSRVANGERSYFTHRHHMGARRQEKERPRIPRETWRRKVGKELKGVRAEASIVARDRNSWRRMISCPVPRLGKRN